MRTIPFIALLLIANTACAQAPTMQWEGEFTQGGLVETQVKPNSEVLLDKRKVPVLPDGRIILGFGRDHPATATLKITTPNGKTTTEKLTITQREYDIQRVNGVPQSTVTPPRKPSIQKRISREVGEIVAARKTSVQEPLFDSGFVQPAEGRISGVYGSQRFYNGTPKRPHFGIDYAAPAGSPAYAPADGIVRMAQANNYFSGGTVIMDHGYNLNSAFLHLQKLHVKVGDKVKQGDLIGDIGAGGRATGPHLDWRMNWFDQRIDPALVVNRFKKQ